ncbi:MAG: ComEC/Rec2-related protein [Pedosphaera sp.]|nr:ComEC/Rec2-related protein [Pedosphaera sp.]
MKRPLIIVALLYVAGILLAQFPVPLPILFTIAFALLIPALFWTRARLVFLCPLILLTGWINHTQCTATLSPNDLRNLLGPRDALVAIRGTLLETPVHRVHKQSDADVHTSMARIRLNAILLDKQNWQPAYGCVVASTRGILPDTIFAGQVVEVFGTLRPAKGPIAEGLFDYRAYLSQQGIYYQLHSQYSTEWQIITSPSHPPLADQFTRWSKKALALGIPVEDEPLHLEWALTLGSKESMSDEMAEPFIRAATYHIFAVDGLRIAIVSGIFLGLLRVLGVPRPFCGLLVAPIILFYAAMTGWPASAIRAIVMILVVFTGWALKRPSDLINSLFAAAIIILVWEPRQLFQAGFQLSFFVVLCIILILPFFNQLNQRLLRSDPLLPEELRPRWQRWLRTPVHYGLDLFFTSIAAWLGSIPLVAYYFHLITPVSGPANVPAVFLCALVLISNLSSLLLAGWFPFAAELFNHAGWFLMKCIQVTSEWSAKWPAAWFYFPEPTLFTTALYYLILLTTLTGWLFRGQWRIWKISGVALLTIIWCIHSLWGQPLARLTILPLNGGHAIYVQSSGGDWLIDTGSKQSVETVVKPFLEAQGVNHLKNVILTHGEANYTGGAELVSDLFRPRNIYTSPVRFRSVDYANFKSSMESLPSWRQPLQHGQGLGCWTVLNPAPNTHFSKADDNALVLRGEFGGTRILLLSSLGRAGQNSLLERTNDLRTDIVVSGIPVEGEPLCDALLEAIQPRIIIITDVEHPATKRASRKLQERLAVKNIPVIYTRTSDAVTFVARKDRWELHAMDGTSFSSRLLHRTVSDPQVSK